MITFYSNSSFISSVNYNEANGNMIIFMRNGKSYFYNHIPRPVFESFKNASSHGTYWNKFIKGKYA